MTQHPRGFLTLSDIAVSEWPGLFDRTAKLKAERARVRPASLAGMTVALVFEKPSTRTRVSFQVAGLRARRQQRGAVVGDLAARPPASRCRIPRGSCRAYCHGRSWCATFGQERVAEFAKWAKRAGDQRACPTNTHPCQVATDLFTVREHFGAIDDLRYAWIGDGNNMANSWLEAAGMFGLELVLACPDGFAPTPRSSPRRATRSAGSAAARSR